MKNKKILYILICVLILFIGLICGIFVGINIGLNMQKVEKSNITQNNVVVKESKESETKQVNNVLDNNSQTFKLNDKISEDEILKLKATIEKDEIDYGNNYQKLEGYEYIIKREPDRIYFKSSKADGFYCFEKTDMNYRHLLEVIEDRMFYSVIEDYNLYCFTPDSINRMMTSGDNYIIYDYDNENLNKSDNEFQKDIIFRFSEKTRLYRLVTYLSYSKEMIIKEELNKNEFADDTTISGFKYMSAIEGN